VGPPPSGGGGGGSPTGGGPGSGGGPDGTGGGDGEEGDDHDTRDSTRPAGSREEFRPIDVPCEIRTYYIDGMTITVGKFEDGWFRSLGQDDREVKDADGKITPVSGVHDFGDPYSDDPEKQPWPIDIEELEEIFQQRQEMQNHPEGDAFWETAGWITSLALDMIPIVGTIKGLAEAARGKDLVTGAVLSTEQRIASGLFALLPFVAAGIGKAAKLITGEALGAARAGKTLTAAQRTALRELQKTVETARKATRGRPPITKYNRCPVTRPRGGHPPPRRPKPKPRRGRSGTRMGCFVAGTAVRTPGNGAMPIEMLEIGALVSAPCASGTSTAQARVASLYRGEAERTVRILFEKGQERREIRCTPRHPFAIDGRFVAAEELRAGDSVSTMQAGDALVKRVTEVPGTVAIYNIEVEEAHCFYVSELDCLVHNCCERLSQRDMKSMLLQLGWDFFKNALGEIIDQPFFKDGAFTGAGQEMSLSQKVAALTGRTVEEAAKLKVDKQINILRRNLGGSTAPDFFVREPGIDHWRSLELKTVGDHQSVTSYFENQQYEYNRMNPERRTFRPEEKNHISNQMSRRFDAMRYNPNSPHPELRNVRHELVIDLRCGGTKTIADARRELRDVMGGRLPSFSNLNGFYTHVRFITAEGGKAVMSSPISMAWNAL
jgi:hypothetical protein